MNPSTQKPFNHGKRWFDEEEAFLLEELHNNIDVPTISKIHKRTIGGITCRINEIAYRMYLKHIPMKTIVAVTKLNEESIYQVIDKKQNPICVSNNNTSDIVELKRNIVELKGIIQVLISTMNINDKQYM